MTMSVSRLPDRFPVGTKYVVEGRGGGDGNLRVFSRFVVLPNGRRIDLPADFIRPPRQRARLHRIAAIRQPAGRRGRRTGHKKHG